MTPSRLMNSCTRMDPTRHSLSVGLSLGCRRVVAGLSLGCRCGQALSVGAEGVGGRLDPPDVRRPPVVAELAGVATTAPVDRLAQDVAVPGVLGGLGDDAHHEV